MINPNKLGGGAWPYAQSQWMLVGVSGVTPPAPGLSDGDPVTTWTDSSGNGHTATQSGSARPTFKTAILNGKPVVRFTSAGLSGLNIASISGTSPWTIFAVMKQAVAANAIGSLMGSTASGHPAMVMATSNVLYLVDNQGYVSSTPTPSFGFHVFSGISTVATRTIYVDGTSTTSANTVLAQSGNFVSIGYDSIGPVYPNGDIAEIIFYNVDVGSTNRANLEKYLGTEYGLTVAGGSAVQPDTVSGLGAWWKADSLL